MMPGGGACLGQRSGVDFTTAQGLVWQNKLDKGFGTTDVPLEFCLLRSLTGLGLR
jgi:hypothetical protein